MQSSNKARFASIILFYCAHFLHAQTYPSRIITKQNDTLTGRISYKLNTAGNSIRAIQIQNKGFKLERSNQKDIHYPPSSLKEVYIYNSNLDTLRLLSIPRTFFEDYIQAIAMDTTQDTHILVRTDNGEGPLNLHTVYTGVKQGYSASGGGIHKVAMVSPNTQLESRKFIAMNRKWTRLPDTRQERNNLLIQTLSDCPALFDKLKKKKINPMKKMDKILSMYNHCKKS